MITDRCRAGRMTIDVFSDDELIYIFNAYRRGSEHYWQDFFWPWKTLIHVCQRWRHIVFASPHHLDVRVDCESITHVTKISDIWPGLPVGIWPTRRHKYGDIIAIALEHRHRDHIARISLPDLTKSRLERCTALMQGPYPVLRYLSLSCCEDPPVITDAFLGGSAPCLQSIILSRIPFPTLPKFLLSVNNLVELQLKEITSAGYISPEVMATCLAMLARLQSFVILFKSTESFPNRKGDNNPSLPRIVLPALTEFEFAGICEYLEHLLVRFDAPLLDKLTLRFFHEPTFDVPQLPQFIHSTERFKAATDIEVHFDHDELRVYVHLPQPVDSNFLLIFERRGLDGQLSLLGEVCTQCFFFSHANRLEFFRRGGPIPDQQNSELWLGFLRPFKAAQILYFSDEEIEVQIARVLGELRGESVAEVLPMLHTLALKRRCRVEPLVTPLLKPFIDARQLWSRPVAVDWISL